MLAAKADLAERLRVVAERKGLTLYALLNEMIETILSVEEEKIDFHKVFEEYRGSRNARELGFILVSEKLLYELIDLCFTSGFEGRLKDSWFEAGLWFSKYVGVGEEASTGEVLLKARSLLWNISELRFEENRGEAELICFSPRFTLNYTILLESFLRGVLKGLGFEVSSSEVDRGFIRLKAKMKVKDA